MKYLILIRYSTPLPLYKLQSRLKDCKEVINVSGRPAAYLLELSEAWTEITVANIKIRTQCSSVEIYLTEEDTHHEHHQTSIRRPYRISRSK